MLHFIVNEMLKESKCIYFEEPFWQLRSTYRKQCLRRKWTFRVKTCASWEYSTKPNFLGMVPLQQFTIECSSIPYPFRFYISWVTWCITFAELNPFLTNLENLLSPSHCNSWCYIQRDVILWVKFGRILVLDFNFRIIRKYWHVSNAQKSIGQITYIYIGGFWLQW